MLLECNSEDVFAVRTQLRRDVGNAIVMGSLGAVLLTILFGWHSVAFLFALASLLSSLFQITLTGGKVPAFALGAVLTWFLHYVLPPLACRAGYATYYKAQLYLASKQWLDHFDYCCWAIVFLYVALLVSLFFPRGDGYNGSDCQTPQGIYSSPSRSRTEPKPTWLPNAEWFCWTWFIATSVLYLLSERLEPDILAEPFRLLSETRIVAAGYILLAGSRGSGLIAGALLLACTLLNSIFTGFFAGLVTSTLPFMFLFFYRFRLRWSALLIIGLAVLGLYVNELVKPKLRQVMRLGEEAAVRTWAQEFSDQASDVNSMVSEKALSRFLGRLDQFWIQDRIMERIPSTIPAQGVRRFTKILRGLVVPRFIDPAKSPVHDFEYFQLTTGHRLNKSTAMDIGPIGEFCSAFPGLPSLVLFAVYGLCLGWGFTRLGMHLAHRSVLWWPWLGYLFSGWVSGTGSTLNFILGTTVNGAVVMCLLFLIGAGPKSFYGKRSVNSRRKSQSTRVMENGSEVRALAETK